VGVVGATVMPKDARTAFWQQLHDAPLQMRFVQRSTGQPLDMQAAAEVDAYNAGGVPLDQADVLSQIIEIGLPIVTEMVSRRAHN